MCKTIIVRKLESGDDSKSVNNKLQRRLDLNHLLNRAGVVIYLLRDAALYFFPRFTAHHLIKREFLCI